MQGPREDHVVERQAHVDRFSDNTLSATIRRAQYVSDKLVHEQQIGVHQVGDGIADCEVARLQVIGDVSI